jgi:hypothetical protein
MRLNWPATDGRIEDPEDTVYVEHYRDFQANQVQERSNPQRLFTSYRVGSQYR